MKVKSLPGKDFPEAALGALDADARPAKSNQHTAAGLPSKPAPELGVSKRTKANWRKLGALEDKKLDQVIEQVKATDDTISTAAVVKVAELRVITMQVAEWLLAVS